MLSVVLPLVATGLGFSSVWKGLVAAAALIGIFVGAPIAGYLTDRLGRKRAFLIDVTAFIVFGSMQAFVTEAWHLFVVRLLLGVAIGAEYAIGAAMLAEFAPTQRRGRRLSRLLVCWFVGYLVAVVLSYVLVDAAGLGWRWVLVTSAVPALIVLLMRLGLPESPRWLMQQGRTEEARAIIDEHLGGEEFFLAEEYGQEQRGGGWRDLFSPELRSRTLFVCLFWSCNIAPYYAIFTFAPQVLGSLGLEDERTGTIAVNALAAVGSLVGMFTIERVGRRAQLIPPYWIMAGALLLVGLWTGAPAAVVVVCVAVFAFVNALQGNLTKVYPIELFPTDVRSSGVGIASAASRLGAATGIFLLPVGLSSIGVGPCMIIGAAICVVGAIASQRLAPETTGLTLSRSSSAAPQPVPA